MPQFLRLSLFVPFFSISCYLTFRADSPASSTTHSISLFSPPSIMHPGKAKQSNDSNMDYEEDPDVQVTKVYEENERLRARIEQLEKELLMEKKRNDSVTGYASRSPGLSRSIKDGKVESKISGFSIDEIKRMKASDVVKFAKKHGIQVSHEEMRAMAAGGNKSAKIKISIFKEASSTNKPPMLDSVPRSSPFKGGSSLASKPLLLAPSPAYASSEKKRKIEEIEEIEAPPSKKGEFIGPKKEKEIEDEEASKSEEESSEDGGDEDF